MKLKTCISVAENNPNKLKITFKKALKKSEYVEIRFDFLKPSDVPNVLQNLKKDLNRAVCTLRLKSEGGKFSGTEKERISILKLIAEYSPYLLDVEYSTLQKNSDLVKYLKGTKTKVLVSWHDFKGTPKENGINQVMKKMSKFSKNIKIVTTAKSIDDVARVLGLYAHLKDQSLIAFAMGDAGRISRILCLYLGAPYTYVSLGKPIAPGQFSVDEMKSITLIKN